MHARIFVNTTPVVSTKITTTIEKKVQNKTVKITANGCCNSEKTMHFCK